MNPTRSYYQVLRVDSRASQDEIKSAYRKLARLYHPDLNPRRPRSAHDRFRQLQEAYEVLSDPASRQRYDESLGIHQINYSGASAEVTLTDSTAWRIRVDDEQDSAESWRDHFNWRFTGGLLLSILSAAWLIYIVNFPVALRLTRQRASIALILFFLGLGIIVWDTFSTDAQPGKRDFEEESLRLDILEMLPHANESPRGLNEYIYQTTGKPGILNLQLSELLWVKDHLQRRIDEGRRAPKQNE